MLEQLQRDGIIYCPWQLSKKEVESIDRYLYGCLVYNAHVQNKGTQVEILADAFNKPNWPTFTVAMQDIILAPYFFEYALKGFDLAQRYFEEFPRLYSMNCFWTQPSEIEYKDTHDWHRDGDDRKQLVMFCYGTDVLQIEHGAHKYQRGTNRERNESRFGYNWKDPPEEAVITILGKAGTCFFTDTWGLHMGIRPNKLRMIMWARWGVSDLPESYVWDKLAPVDKVLLGDRYPQDPALQEAIRLVVK